MSNQVSELSKSLNLQSFAVPGGRYGYTAANVQTLTSFENTLAVGLYDESGSTSRFALPMEACAKAIVKSLRYSPRADNLIYRQCHFGTNFREHHGFTPLAQLNESNYDGCYQPGGTTHLYDSSDRVIAELIDYAKQQSLQRYTCNGIIYMITDGCDYGSSLTQVSVMNRLAEAIACEELESLVTILIGVNDDPTIQADLKKYKEKAGFTSYVELKNADEKTLANLANFISHSISSQSQQLGSGGPSQIPGSLTF